MSTTPASVAAPREGDAVLSGLRFIADQCRAQISGAEFNGMPFMANQSRATLAIVEIATSLIGELLAMREGGWARWVPWKQWDALPASNWYWVTTDEGKTEPAWSYGDRWGFLQTEVIAYWSAPLAPPYAASEAPPSKDAGAV